MASTVSNSKNVKTRREAAVQGTNDSSIVSKWSTAASGYFDDLFLHHFISKQSRRAPLIHRGYYIRAKAFDRIIKNFLKTFQHTRTQILSLGTGFDSTYFRLKSANFLKRTSFYEIDFPEVVKRKKLLIENSSELSQLIEKCSTAPSSPYIELSCTDYQLLGVDLTQLNTLEAALKMCGVDFGCPTLLLSECVMTYMTRRCSTELVRWAAETFEQGVFGMYEQINPDDAFGLFMQAHFHSIGSPLKCINSFPTLESQENRFLKAGWGWCEALDMNTFYYNCLDTVERQRVERLETFDEYEELNLKYSHYFILTASTVDMGLSLVTEDRNLSDESRPSAVSDLVTLSRLDECDVRRFGHSSSLVGDRYAVTSGGFGETDGRHQRLADITVTDLHTLKSYNVPFCSGEMQVSRMHHSSVTLSDGSVLLLHGRQSPYFMCNQILKIQLKISHTSLETNSQILSQHENSSPSCAQSTLNQNSALHNAGDFKMSNSKEFVNEHESVRTSSHQCSKAQPNNASTHDKSQTESSRLDKADSTVSEASQPSYNQVQSSKFDVGIVTVSVVEQKGEVPQERWRHASVVVSINGKEQVFLYGGKTKSSSVLEDCHLFDPATNTWKKCCPTGDSPGPRHSHCLTSHNGMVILSGGLDQHHMPCSDVFIFELSSMTWGKLNVDGTLYARYSHTAHMCEDKLLLFGGVNTDPTPPGLAVISLTSHTAQEFALPAQDKNRLLMLHRHTSVMPTTCGQSTSMYPLVLLGGGGNCFSFGTHLNQTPVIVDVDKICQS